MEEEPTISAEAEPNADRKLPDDEGVDLGIGNVARCDVDFSSENMIKKGTIRTLDGEMAGDELEGDSINCTSSFLTHCFPFHHFLGSETLFRLSRHVL